MNKILLLSIILLSLIKHSIQDCCFITTTRGIGNHLYNVDLIVKPSAQQVQVHLLSNYGMYISDECSVIGDGSENKIICNNDNKHPDFFETFINIPETSPEIVINDSDLNLDIRADGQRCTRSFDSCNADGTSNYSHADEYCLSILGCYPKLACYIALGVFVLVIAGIIIAVVRRNSGSAEKAALDRPNTKVAHLDARPEPINKYSSNNYSSGYSSGYSNNNNSSNTKETLIQIEEMPVDFKEAGSTNWVNKKYNSPANQNSDLGLGLGSGGFGSKSSLLPQASNINVINDPVAGLNRGRSIKRTQSTKSTKSMKKPRSNEPSHLNQPLLPAAPPPVHTSGANLNRSKSARSTRSVKSSKSTRKPRVSEIPAGAVNALATRSKSMRSQPKRYQLPSDSESDSDSDSDNEVLGLRAKPSMKRTNGSSQKRSLSVRHKTTKY